MSARACSVRKFRHGLKLLGRNERAFDAEWRHGVRHRAAGRRYRYLYRRLLDGLVRVAHGSQLLAPTYGFARLERSRELYASDMEGSSVIGAQTYAVAYVFLFVSRSARFGELFCRLVEILVEIDRSAAAARHRLQISYADRGHFAVDGATTSASSGAR